MSNLETLTSKSSENILNDEPEVALEQPNSPPPIRCTPDLVQDLPVVDNTSDTSPVGSYKETRLSHSPPAPKSVPAPAAVNNTAPVSADHSAAEALANSDGTIVRIKSSSTSSEPRSPTAMKFPIQASFSKTRELSSFKRSISLSGTSTQKDEGSDSSPTLPTMSQHASTSGLNKPQRAPTVTGKAIHVRAPSIPTHLDLVGSKSKPINPPPVAAVAAPEDMSRSLPTTPAAPQSKAPSFPPAPPITSYPSPSPPPPQAATRSDPEPPSALAAAGPQKFKKPPPPVKAKPKPPPPPPKPKK